LATISGSSYTLTDAASIAIGPNGNYLYVATVNGMVPFTINTSTGTLTQGTAFGDSLGEAIAVDPSGQWLLDASLTGTLIAYPITSTGALDTSSSRSVQATAYLASNTVEPGGIAISPNGAVVAVALGQTGTQIFPFNANNALPIGAPYPTQKPYGSGDAIAVAIDPQSRLLYIGETLAFNSLTNSGALRVFTIGSNSVSEFNYTAPYAPAGTGSHAILPISTGGYVYVASWQSGTAGSITGYSVTTSALTPLSSTVATGTEPYGLAEDGTDNFVLAVSNSGTTFDAYTLGSGQLTSPITGSPVLSPIAIVAAP
jgi:6-phosphogluconolactonase (cycloisomerase 2 family)